MRARNKKQRRIVYIDKSLPEMTLEQQRWAYDKTLFHKAIINKGGRLGCLDCGYIWKATFKQSWKEVICTQACSRCGVKLKVENSQKRNFYDWSYFTTIEVHKEYQVIRNYKVHGHYTIGKKRNVFWYEVGRIYIDPTGNDVQVVGQYVQYSWSGDNWQGSFELRDKETCHKHNINSRYVYPIRKVIKKIRRNGFKQGLHNQSPYSLFSALLSSSTAETLMKTKQYELLSHYISNHENIDKYWSTIKIAMKNNYMIKDPSTYFDYLGFLKKARRDLHSPKYICPKDLHREHNRYLDKIRRAEEALELEERIRKIKEAEAIYKINNRRFFSLNIKNENIIIRSFRTVKQVQRESWILKHCAFESNYYSKIDSLLLSAKIDKKPVETIQVCLRTYKVLQTRGWDNEPTIHSRIIIKLVNNSMNEIKALHSCKTKTKKMKSKKVA